MTGSGCGMGPPGPPSYSASLQRLVTAARRTHPVVSKLVKNGQAHRAQWFQRYMELNEI
jgi:hypothetical protein